MSEKPIRLSGHARQQLARRGATEEEVVQAIRSTTWQPAEYCTTRSALSPAGSGTSSATSWTVRPALTSSAPASSTSDRAQTIPLDLPP